MVMLRGRAFTAADNETAAPVAVVNEGFVKRFFKSDEDPLGQHFGLNLPQNVGTYRIIGVGRDAKFASFALRRPARPMFFVPLAQYVDYKDAVMPRVEAQSHFIRGLMLVTRMAPGTLEPLLTKTLGEVDPTLTINSVRTLRQQVETGRRRFTRGLRVFRGDHPGRPRRVDFAGTGASRGVDVLGQNRGGRKERREPIFLNV